MGNGVVGFEADRRAERGYRLSQLFLVLQSVAEVQMGCGEFRLELDRRAAGGNRVGKLSLLP